MSVFHAEKVISSLPATLTPNTLYYVRVADGFDIHLSDSTGNTAHKLNMDSLSHIMSETYADEYTFDSTYYYWAKKLNDNDWFIIRTNKSTENKDIATNINNSGVSYPTSLTAIQGLTYRAYAEPLALLESSYTPELKHKRTNTWPLTSPDPNTIYYMNYSDGYEQYLTDDNGNYKFINGMREGDFTMSMLAKGGANLPSGGLIWEYGKYKKTGSLVSCKLGFTLENATTEVINGKAYMSLGYLPFQVDDYWANIDQAGVNGFAYTGISSLQDTFIAGGIDGNNKIWVFLFYTSYSEARVNGQFILDVTYHTTE